MKDALLMQHLLSDFEFADIDKWERQVLKDLGLESIEQLTQIQLADGIIQSPYSDVTSNPGNHFQHSFRYCITHSGENWQGARYWLNMERFEGFGPAKLNQLSLAALTGGVDGIILEADGVKHWKQLLEGIPLSDCYLGVEGTLPDIQKLVEFLVSLKSNHQGFFIINGLLRYLENVTPDLLELLNGNHGFRTLILQELTAEPSTLDEIALLLSQGIFTINTLLESDIPMLTILKNIQINLLLGDSYLWEICRLKCLRILFHQVVQQYGTTNYLPGSLTIQATTNGFQGQKKNQNQQLLCNTTQTMAAVLGGCNIVTIVPHQDGFSSDDQWSRRIARNISHILKEECNLHKMADPVAGSYYLEDLTDKMLKEVWSRLRQMESSGGYLKYRGSQI